MNKQEFLSKLRKGISGLPQADIEEQVSFYSEMIDDRMEEGLSEAEAVEAIGPVDAIVSQIIADTPITKLVKEKIRPKKKHNAWVIVLLVIGSPVWLSLLLAAFAVILSLYAVLWAVVISFWAIFVSLAVSTLGGIAGGVFLLCKGNVMTDRRRRHLRRIVRLSVLLLHGGSPGQHLAHEKNGPVPEKRDRQ